MTAAVEAPTARRCPTNGRHLEQAERWLCPRCLREYHDGPELLGAPRRSMGHDLVGGRPVNLKLGAERLDAVDAYAAAHGITRARAVRQLIDDGLHSSH